jgi:hypothetical protein
MELPSLDSLLGFDSTRPHSDSDDALNQKSLTLSTLQIQGVGGGSRTQRSPFIHAR